MIISHNLQKECRCELAISDLKMCFGRKICLNLPMRSRAVAFCLQVPKLCTELDSAVLYILILGTCSKFARQNMMLALGVSFPQTCLSAGRRFAASRSRLHYYHQVESTEYPRSFELYPSTPEEFLNGCCTPAGFFLMVVIGCIMGTDQTLF